MIDSQLLHQSSLSLIKDSMDYNNNNNNINNSSSKNQLSGGSLEMLNKSLFRGSQNAVLPMNQSQSPVGLAAVSHDNILNLEDSAAEEY